jgi:hypothetical protein
MFTVIVGTIGLVAGFVIACYGLRGERSLAATLKAAADGARKRSE